MMVQISDVFARVANVGISDELAAAMIEEASLSAAAQVREECHRRRQAEKDHLEHQAVVESERKQFADEVSAHREREAEISRRRTEELLKVEAMSPARKRDSGW